MESSSSSSSTREGVVAAILRVKLQNPFVLRVGQVMTGFGLGCGLGIGVGVPIPMDIPGVAQVMSAANGMTRHIGGGRQLQGVIKRVGIKNLEAGIGCGVGLGHGFGIGLSLKPGVTQSLLHIVQEGFAAVTKKVLPGNDGEAQIGGLGVHGSQSKVLQPAFPPTPLSQLNNTPSLKSSESEVERLHTQNEILRTLLRHQEKIEELEHDNALLREELNNKGILATTISGSQTSRNPNLQLSSANCFTCRMRSRRRT